LVEAQIGGYKRVIGNALRSPTEAARRAEVAIAVHVRDNHHFSHFGPSANLLEELEAVFASYSARGAAKTLRTPASFFGWTLAPFEIPDNIRKA
jgi:phosphoribulokinase